MAWWTGSADDLMTEAVQLEDEGFDEAARSLVLIGIEDGILDLSALVWWDHAEDLAAMVEEPTIEELRAGMCYGCPCKEYGCCSGC